MILFGHHHHCVLVNFEHRIDHRIRNLLQYYFDDVFVQKIVGINNNIFLQSV